MADEVSTAVADVEVAAVEEATAPGKLMSILHFLKIRLQDMGFVKFSCL